MKKNTNAVPQKPVTKLSSGHRALGRLVNLDLPELKDESGVPPQTDATDWLNANKMAKTDANVDLAGDVFWNMFQRDARQVDEVPEERIVNKRLLDWMNKAPGLEKTKAHTTANLPASLASSKLLWRQLLTDESVSEALRKQDELDALKKEADESRAKAEAFRQEMDRAGADHDDATANFMMDAVSTEANNAVALDHAIEQLTGQIEDELDEMEGDATTKAIVSAAANAAAEEAEEVAQALAGFGLGAGENVREDPKEALEFLSKMGGEIAEIAKLAGRIKGIAITAAREKVAVGPVATNVGLTKNPQRVFLSEMALFRPEVPLVIRAQQAARLVDDGLLGWTPDGDGETEGPFVAAVDFSPSMHGGSIIVAKAIALGLAQAARVQGREYILFCFASDENAIVEVTSSDGWKEHIEWASAKTSGGTDFDLAMRTSIASLRKIGSVDNADLMFLSDGEGRMHDTELWNWKKFKDETGARLYYVPCERPNGWKYDRFNMREIADEVIELDDLDEKSGTELAKRVGSW